MSDDSIGTKPDGIEGRLRLPQGGAMNVVRATFDAARDETGPLVVAHRR